MPKVASLPTQHRFHKLVWGDKSDSTSGLIVGGSDQGLISVYDAGKLMAGGGEGCLVMSRDKHMGPVGALDFNPFQSNLVASGASESEIFIWDMNKPGKRSPAQLVCSVNFSSKLKSLFSFWTEIS